MRARVWLESGSIAQMFMEARRALPDETGGLLVGYTTGADTCVTRVVGPGPLAKHRTDTFEPDYEFQDNALERIHADTVGSESYLGDWHSHPDGKLYLSPKDVTVLRQIAEYEDSGLLHPLMLVVATAPDYRAAVWRYRKRRWHSSTEACELLVG